MRRPFALLAVVLLVAATGSVGAAAQAGTPAPAAGPPEGITLEVLAQAAVAELPPAPAELFLFRVTFAPGASDQVAPEPTSDLIAVESGRLAFTALAAVRVTRVAIAATPVAAEVAATGVEFTLGPGDSVLIPAGTPFGVRNDGAEAATAVVLGFGPPAEAEGTPAAGGTPPADEEEAPGLAFEFLAFGLAEQMPSGPAAIVVARFAAEPGAGVGPVPHPGPEVVAVEAGSFVFQSVEGPPFQVVRGLASMDVEATPGAEPPVEEVGPGQEATVNAGDALFIPVGSSVTARNDGAEAAVAVFGAIEPLAAEGTPDAATPVARAPRA